jgi:hypothetical protein
LFFIIYQTLRSIPFSIFSSFIVISLTYRCLIDLIDYILIYKNKSIPYFSKLLSTSRDSFCCDLFCVNDENEAFYSKCDVDYVLNLLNSKNDSISKKTFQKIKKHYYLTEKVEKKGIGIKLLSVFKSLFSWDPYFRFSSRVVNTLVVTFVVLYYIVIFWTYFIAYNSKYFTNLIPEEVDLRNMTIPIGELLCQLSEEICIESFQNYTLKLPIPEKIIQILPWIRDSILWVFAAPLIISPLICLLQIFLISRDIKTHLKQLYKGECDFIQKAVTIGNASIANSSFHFGGYMVGYMCWGYIIIYFFILIIGLAILTLRIFCSPKFWLDILQRPITGEIY